MAFNPFAAVPVAFGIILMKIVGYLQEAASLGDPGTDVQGIMTSYQYVFDKLFSEQRGDCLYHLCLSLVIFDYLWNFPAFPWIIPGILPLLRVR